VTERQYDIVLLHPPAVYDFRRKTIFPGLAGATVDQVQFSKVPIGMLSIADYLDRHSYRVIIDNLGDRMVRSKTFEAEDHLKTLNAPIYAVGLHFQQHAQGAIEIARLCKALHPGSLVILGGLTATRFHREILEKYSFIDAVVRGEAEKPLLELMRSFEKHGRLTPTSNLSYRDESGEIQVTPLSQVCSDLDEFEYTRFDLMQPLTSIFDPDFLPRWSLEVCRGCVYNCAICGGSAYSYRTYLGREKPAFRSPAKIVEDIRSLNRQGVHIIGLYQDPRMGGETYWKDLLERLRTGKLEIDRLSLDLLAPADEAFIEAVARTRVPVTVHICPDSGCEKVRKLLDRNYSNEELLRTVRLCHKYLIPVTTFFSAGLAGEDRENIGETWELMDRLSSMEQIMFTRSSSMGSASPGSGLHLGGPISGPILVDPGSPAFDNPQKYGYKLLFHNLEEYIRGLSAPSWHQWINYETDLLTKDAIIQLILEATAVSINQREEYELNGHGQAEMERQKLKADITVLNEINRISRLKTAEEQEKALQALKGKIEQ
jgi:B12-binding domain/radical SAM domain protein